MRMRANSLASLGVACLAGVYSWHGWESVTEFDKWVKSQGDREDAMTRGMAEFRRMMESRRIKQEAVSPTQAEPKQANTTAAYDAKSSTPAEA